MNSAGEVMSEAGVAQTCLLPVGYEEVQRDQMRDEKLAFFVSHREIIRAAVFEIAKTGDANSIAVNDRPRHDRDFGSPMTIMRRADAKPPDKHAQKYSCEGEKHSWSPRHP